MTLEQMEENLKMQFKKVDDIAFLNQKKVMQAFIANRISTQHFAGTSGYGYDDTGRDTLAKLYATVFGTESAIVSPLITCGSHAISTVLYGLLRPKDVLLSITGDLYDTLQETLFGKDNGSLEDFGISYQQVELKDGCIDLPLVLEKVKAVSPKSFFYNVLVVIAVVRHYQLLIWNLFFRN